ncbi:MAG: ABC transporter permease [Chloroflexi bacterium]|nr:ABC transporter permease [Chloroflexota bacterium]MBU1750561.1 ABC transporter permease [Chloroflexota bacterium]MBU1878072.1 ABC transporter permease [Chloroflexota bacterium]
MNLMRLVRQNIAGSAFRSGAVFLCAALVAALTLSATAVVRGAEDNLQQGIQRLGADIIVVPWGTRSWELASARLVSMPRRRWMHQATLGRLTAVPGVAAVSPQLYVLTLEDASRYGAAEVVVTGYDPATDFILRPWLPPDLDLNLRPGEAIGGSEVVNPQGDRALTVQGYPLTLVGNLVPSGTSLDQGLFVTFETAQDLALHVGGLEIAPESMSAALVRVHTGSDPHPVSVQIMEDVRGVLPIEMAGLFQTERSQMVGLLYSVLGVLGVTWALSMVFMGLVFALVANERRREIGMLRALGATRTFILRSLLVEGALLALAGGVTGIVLASLIVVLLRDAVVQVIGLPFVVPELPALVALALGSLVLTLGTVTLAALVPALRISRLDPALAMRE